VGRLGDGVGALEDLEVRLGVIALDGANEELERLAFGGLARAQTCEQTSPALGPNLLATLQVEPPRYLVYRRSERFRS